jgi:hypothetical protein
MAVCFVDSFNLRKEGNRYFPKRCVALWQWTKMLINISDKRKNILKVGSEILNKTHVKVKLPLCLIKHRVLKAYGKSGSIAPRNLELRTKWKWLVVFKLWPRVRLSVKWRNRLYFWQSLKMFMNFWCHRLTRCLQLVQLWLIHELFNCALQLRNLDLYHVECWTEQDIQGRALSRFLLY